MSFSVDIASTNISNFLNSLIKILFLLTFSTQSASKAPINPLHHARHCGGFGRESIKKVEPEVKKWGVNSDSLFETTFGKVRFYPDTKKTRPVTN